jgi:hypothetical protein
VVKWGRVIVGAASTRSSTNVPERIGRYEILLPIASGGMATVYLARAVAPNGLVTEVALKLTHAHLSSSTEFANDLVEEGKLAARIRHRNVVSVIDVGDDPSGLYLVMEYIEGETLGGLIRGSVSMPASMGVRLLIDALAGLHAAHELRGDDGALVGVVHRDFTPQNILVGVDGVARLADFGIAKAATRLGHTRTGIVKGKIAYMAPEQAHGTPLDRRCDVWAAGVVAWELFARRRLHGHDDDISTLLRVATVPPPLLRTVVPDLPEAIEAAVAGALTMNAEGRYPTALAFSRDLGAACRDTVGIAEVDEVSAWMARNVAPRVSGQRLQVARMRAHRETTDATRVDGVLRPGVTGSVVLLDETDIVSMQTETVQPEQAATVLVPTLVAEQETRQLTDAVSVVARRGRIGRSIAVGPRALVAAGLLGALLIVGVTAWRVSATRAGTQETDEQPAVTVTPPPTAASATASPTVARTLRIRANAAIASLRVNDRSVPVNRPSTTVPIDLAPFDQETSLAIDAVAVDGRRAGVAVPTGATDVTLEFRPPSPQALPVRVPSPRPTAPAAPLAPSPY